jgi:hypothetical protein
LLYVLLEDLKRYTIYENMNPNSKRIYKSYPVAAAESEDKVCTATSVESCVWYTAVENLCTHHTAARYYVSCPEVEFRDALNWLYL